VTLPANLNDRELDKFEDVSGETVVKTRVVSGAITGEFSPSGLINGGLITEVTLNSSTWTALPATPLSDRNALAIQNYSGQDIKINYDNSAVGYVGVLIKNESERNYDVKDTIIIYAKSSTSSCTVTVEEIS